MFRSTVIVALLLIATLAVACSESATAPSPAAQSAATPVADGVWRLQSFRRADASVVPVPDPDRFTIEVGTDGRLSVRSDCNRCAGSYAQAGDGLRIGPAMACTKAFCSATAPFDTEFERALTDATLVRTSHGSLEAVSGAGVLRFAR
jgi:heat shock protein HslJ